MDLREKFWKKLAELPLVARNYFEQGDDCRSEKPLRRDFFDPPPAHEDFKSLPYVDVTITALLMFVNEDSLAEKMLNANGDWASQDYDYQLPYLHAKLLYIQSEPVTRYKPYLDVLIERAHTNLARVEARCGRSACKDEMERLEEKIRKHARHVETTAMNLIAYGIAQDLASGERAAEPLEPIAEEYADRLARIVKEIDHSVEDGSIGADGDPKSVDSEKNAIRDTVAFVSMVVQARKPQTDEAKIKVAIADLELALAYYEDLERLKPVDEHDHAVLQAVRAHLTSARKLITE